MGELGREINDEPAIQWRFRKDERTDIESTQEWMRPLVTQHVQLGKRNLRQAHQGRRNHRWLARERRNRSVVVRIAPEIVNPDICFAENLDKAPEQNRIASKRPIRNGENRHRYYIATTL